MKPASSEVISWKTNGGSVAGTAGVALGTDGTVYVATGDGTQSATAFSNAVVSLDGKTLTAKDSFTPGKTPFTTSPVVFRYKDKDLIAAANKDGRVYLLDGAQLGGADHRTPLAKSPLYTSGMGEFAAGAVSTFEDTTGARWLLVASAGPIHAEAKAAASNGPVTSGAIVAFKLIDQGGVLSLQPAWVSRDMTAPVTPTIVNGVVFALASGENVQVAAAQRAQRSTPAILYALDAATGRELWTSGTSIGSFVHAIGPAANDSQVYVVGHDGTLYTFGFDVER
jgi:outer membrane protein assembly factor BamB